MAQFVDNATSQAFGKMTAGAGGTANYLAMFDSATLAAGNLLFYVPLINNVVSYASNADDDYIYAPGHAFSDTDPIRFADAVPTGLTIDTLYYARDTESGERFKVAATSGGVAINLTTNTSGRVGDDQAITVANNTIPTFDAASIVVRQRGTDYNAAGILDGIFNQNGNYGGVTTPPTIYLGLLTAAPSDSDSGATVTEISYTGYARLTTSTSDWDAASDV